MPDRFGPRGTFAMLIPLQNANMQPEYEALRPEGINNQIYRFDISAHDKASDAILGAVPGCLLCWPDMIIGGTSLEMHAWSRQQQADYRARFMEQAQGTPTVLATDATEAALKTIGAKRIGILAPMSAENSKSAQDYYEAAGFEVPYTTSLRIKKSEEIIKVTVAQIHAGFEEIDHKDVDTLLHVGGGLGIVGMIEELEARFGKPVVSVNAATYWYALRRHGITDPVPGFGQLLLRMGIVE
ncbi:MAG: maleate isomerase [Alphaproteobacteria bacterium]|jgi:maleate isomerase